MPYKDPLIRNQKQRERYQIIKENSDSYLNSEKRKAYKKQWRENNRDYYKTPEERKKQRVRQMKRKNKELENRPDKYEYNHTEKQKIMMRHTWCRDKDKVFKLRECQFEMVWDKYCNTTHCELCNISLKKVRKVMEHHHPSGYFRYIACQRCNGYLRYVDENKDKAMKELLER